MNNNKVIHEDKMLATFIKCITSNTISMGTNKVANHSTLTNKLVTLNLLTCLCYVPFKRGSTKSIDK